MHEKEMVMPLTEDMCVGSTYPPRDESFEERQLRLLESIDRKLGKLVQAQTISCAGKTTHLKSKSAVA